MSTTSTPASIAPRYKSVVSYIRGGCYSSPKSIQGVAQHAPATASRESAITGFRTVLNHRASTPAHSAP